MQPSLLYPTTPTVPGPAPRYEHISVRSGIWTPIVTAVIFNTSAPGAEPFPTMSGEQITLGHDGLQPQNFISRINIDRG